MPRKKLIARLKERLDLLNLGVGIALGVLGIFAGVAGYGLKRTKAQLDNRLAGWEVQQLQEPVPEITLAATSFRRGSICLLDLKVQVKNTGKARIRLGFSQAPLSVARATPSGDSVRFTALRPVPALTFTAEGDEVLPLPSARLLPGESGSFPFLVPVPDSGLYFVQFYVPVGMVTAESEARPARARGGAKAEGSGESPWYWTARAYVNACPRPETPPRPRG